MGALISGLAIAAVLAVIGIRGLREGGINTLLLAGGLFLAWNNVASYRAIWSPGAAVLVGLLALAIAYGAQRLATR